jgi:glycosyltransferase involved in cell wall biosynthesis
MSRLLLVSNDNIGREMAGPGIRYLQFARKLSEQFDVTLVVPNEIDIEVEGVELLQATQLRFPELKRRADQFDVVVTQRLSPRAMRYLAGTKTRVIYDLYCPFVTEHLGGFAGESGSPQWRELAYRASTLLQELCLATGNAFICASEAQRDLWLGYLGALGRVTVSRYQHDPSLEELITVVPFGIDPELPVAAKPALKGVVPGIRETDKVLLWGGGIWNWFDPLTLIRAVARISEQRDDVKLYFLGVKHPNPDIPEMRMADQAVALAKELSVLDRFVFFNYDWVPYAERANHFLDADVGVSTHFASVETRFAFRTRILDYFWAGLPTVTTEGDVLATLVESRGLGRTVEAEDVEGWARALQEVLDDQDERARIAANLESVRAELLWPRVIEPLAELAALQGERVDSRQNLRAMAARYRWTAGRSVLKQRGPLATAGHIVSNKLRPRIP